MPIKDAEQREIDWPLVPFAGDERLFICEPMSADLIKHQASVMWAYAYKLTASDLGWLVAAGATLSQYLLPDQSARVAAGAAGFLTIMDSVTAMAAVRLAVNPADREPVSSAKFSRIFVKVFVYGVFVITCSLASKSLPGAVNTMLAGMSVSGALGLIIFREVMSIFENCRKMGFDFMPALGQHFDKPVVPPMRRADDVLQPTAEEKI